MQGGQGLQVGEGGVHSAGSSRSRFSVSAGSRPPERKPRSSRRGALGAWGSPSAGGASRGLSGGGRAGPGSGLRGRPGERRLRKVPAHAPLRASHGGSGAAPSYPASPRREAVCLAPGLARRLLSHAAGERGRCPNLRTRPRRVGRGVSRGSAAPPQRTPTLPRPGAPSAHGVWEHPSLPPPGGPAGGEASGQRSLPRHDPLPSSGGPGGWGTGAGWRGGTALGCGRSKLDVSAGTVERAIVFLGEAAGAAKRIGDRKAHV